MRFQQTPNGPNSLFMCQDEDENEDENQSFGSFWCIFNIMGNERTSTSSLLRLRTNQPYCLVRSLYPRH